MHRLKHCTIKSCYHCYWTSEVACLEQYELSKRLSRWLWVKTLSFLPSLFLAYLVYVRKLLNGVMWETCLFSYLLLDEVLVHLLWVSRGPLTQQGWTGLGNHSDRLDWTASGHSDQWVATSASLVVSSLALVKWSLPCIRGIMDRAICCCWQTSLRPLTVSRASIDSQVPTLWLGCLTLIRCERRLHSCGHP